MAVVRIVGAIFAYRYFYNRNGRDGEYSPPTPNPPESSPPKPNPYYVVPSGTDPNQVESNKNHTKDGKIVSPSDRQTDLHIF